MSGAMPTVPTHTLQQTLVERSTTYDLHDVPDLCVGVTGGTFRPDRAVVYTFNGRPMQIAVSGRILAPSGRLASSRRTLSFRPTVDGFPDAPAFVQSVAASHAETFGDGPARTVPINVRYGVVLDTLGSVDEYEERSKRDAMAQAYLDGPADVVRIETWPDVLVATPADEPATARDAS